MNGPPVPRESQISTSDFPSTTCNDAGPIAASFEMLAPNFHPAPVPPDPVENTPTYSPSEVPSYGGHGILEVLEVTRFLEKHGIECCIVGVSALMFYGAARVRDVRPCRAPPPPRRELRLRRIFASPRRSSGYEESLTYSCRNGTSAFPMRKSARPLAF